MPHAARRLHAWLIFDVRPIMREASRVRTPGVEKAAAAAPRFGVRCWRRAHDCRAGRATAGFGCCIREEEMGRLSVEGKIRQVVRRRGRRVRLA